MGIRLAGEKCSNIYNEKLQLCKNNDQRETAERRIHQAFSRLNKLFRLDLNLAKEPRFFNEP
jgi:hypothetical protein